MVWVASRLSLVHRDLPKMSACLVGQPPVHTQALSAQPGGRGKGHWDSICRADWLVEYCLSFPVLLCIKA